MKLFRIKKNLKKTGKNNNICKIKNISGNINGEGNTFSVNQITGKGSVIVDIKGNNNKISFGNIQNDGNIVIIIIGNNNEITLNDDIQIVDKLALSIAEGCENGKITVGAKTTFWNTKLQTCENNSSIEVGEDCMFSYNTKVFNSDGHCIIQNNEIVNKAKTTKIENHVWLGYEAVVLKNSYIGAKSVIGYRAIVSGNYPQQGVVLAGVPAKIVKENINWNRYTPNEYEKMQNEVV